MKNWANIKIDNNSLELMNFRRFFKKFKIVFKDYLEIKKNLTNYAKNIKKF